MNASTIKPLARLRVIPTCCATLLVAMLPVVPALAVSLSDLPQRWIEDDGRELALNSLAGRRIVLTMAYAGCHVICPQTVDQLRQMQRRLDMRGEQAEFVIVGYDPENDRPSDWRAVRTKRHLDRGNWHLLSGSLRDTERLAHQLGFEFWKYDEHVMHGMRAVVFDAQGYLQLEFGPETKVWANVI